MLNGIIGFFAGMFLSAAVIFALLGTDKDKQNEAYMEGYNAGWKACMDKNAPAQKE